MQDSGTYELTLILGAAALLLWGVRMARTGVMRVYGAQIRRTLPRALNNRLVARGEVVIVDDRLGVTMTEIIKDGDTQG